MKYAPNIQSCQVAKSVDYSQQLIRCPSVTPLEAGAHVWLCQMLTALGFSIIPLNKGGVSNFIAKIGQGERKVGFVGHTDVVPPGPLEKWDVPPFDAVIKNGELIGRGAADMKTGIAAMLAATERFLTDSKLSFELYWLITSDEEGEAEHGSKVLKHYLDEQGIVLDMCIVGEPTASKMTGDTLKIGRRGAISGVIAVSGVQGHVAYPNYADNAIHKAAKIIQRLVNINWDSGSNDFPGSSLQITHIDSGRFTDNIVPAQCRIAFNIRYSHYYSETSVKSLIAQCIEEVAADCQTHWERPCEPYHTAKREGDDLIGLAEAAIRKTTGLFPVLSTAGGTSDGRFFASSDTQVIELGVPNKTIHQVNERIDLSDLVILEEIYLDLLTRLN